MVLQRAPSPWFQSLTSIIPYSTETGTALPKMDNDQSVDDYYCLRERERERESRCGQLAHVRVPVSNVIYSVVLESEKM
jgi:hypothetical protein